ASRAPSWWGWPTATRATCWPPSTSAPRATSRAAASTGSGAGRSCATPRSGRCGPSRSGARRGRSGRRVELAGERGLAAGGGVAVDHTLGHRAIDDAGGLANRGGRLATLAGEGFPGDPDARAHRAADGPVAQAPLLVLLDPLLRGARVGHGLSPFRGERHTSLPSGPPGVKDRPGPGMSEPARDTTGGHEHVQRGGVSAVGAIGLATLTSRVLGYIRDMVVAHAFGEGPLSDASLVALRVPHLRQRPLGEGALATAVIPVFTETLTRGGPTAFARLARATTGAAIVVLCLVSALGVLLSRPVVALMAPGWRTDDALFDLAVMLTRVMFPYLVLVGLAALAMGALNAHHRFFTAAVGPAVLNVAMILAVLALAAHLDPPVLSLAVGVLVGGLGQLLVQLPELRRLGVPLTPSAEWRHPAVGRIAHRLWPAVFALAAVQITVVVNTLLASLLPAGTVSYLYYADRVMEFPLGIFGIALATAALPSMSAQAARGELAALRATLEFALRMAAFVAVPAAVGLVMLGGPIVTVLFQRGEFSAGDAMLTAQALTGYA